jgi:hypothetical protein
VCRETGDDLGRNGLATIEEYDRAAGEPKLSWRAPDRRSIPENWRSWSAL